MFNLAVVMLMENRKLENIEGKKIQKEKNYLGLSRGIVQKQNLGTKMPAQIYVAFYRIIFTIPICVYSLLKRSR